MTRFILAIDQGTTGSTGLVIGADGSVLGRNNHEFPQHFPNPGWVEHDLGDIWESVGKAVSGALEDAGVDAKDCAGIGITNQRETTVVWDRATGDAIHRAIVWQDRRTADRCQTLKEAGHETKFKSRTGLVLDPYFSGTKVAWILDHVEGARARAEAGQLAFGTIDSWLVSRLSGGSVHATDATNASRTLMYDILRGSWDEELLGLLHVPKEVLPSVRGCSEVYGHTKGLSFLPDGIPLAGMAGDQQAALFGQTCFLPGEAKCTYGTGAFLLMNTGTTMVPSSRGLISTIAWRLGDKTTYALEGSSFIAGAAVQWLRDGLKMIENALDIEALAASVDSAGDVVFVPALSGLGAPYWDPHARGLIMGLSRDTTQAHLARATLEGIALQITDLCTAMVEDSSVPIRRLRVDGGASNNALLMQYQADVLNVGIDRPKTVETTGLGAAYLAGLSVGMFSDLSAVSEAYQVDAQFEATMGQEARNQHLARWADAVGRTRTDGVTA